jgi:hypothetical protein
VIIEDTARDGEARADPKLGLLLCRFLDAGEYNGSHALDRPASKKRQGTKSRSVVRRRCGARYGDLSAA